MTAEATIAIPDLLTNISITFGGMTGAMHGARKRMDLFGTLVVAVAAAIGAGIVRDLAIGRLPAFLYSSMVGYAILGGIAGYFLARAMRFINRTIFLIDTLLIGAWVCLGAELALLYGGSKFTAVFIGILAAVGGGVLRDVLCRDIPTAFNPVHFETAGAMVASITFIAVDSFGSRGTAQTVAIVSAALLRLLAVRYRWHSISAVELSERLRGRAAHYDPATGTITVMKQPLRR